VRKRFLLKTPGLPVRGVDDDALVITPGDATLHTMNATARFIWEQADGRTTLEDIASRLVATFAVNEQTARAEAEAFVETALERGLLTAHEAPTL